MDIFVQPLFGREEPIGTAFISYARKDREYVRGVIEKRLSAEGIFFVRDEKDIITGKTIEEIRKMVGRASCGVIVLSDRSLRSAWVLYEVGLLEGLGRAIIPFYEKPGTLERLLIFLPAQLKRLMGVRRGKPFVSRRPPEFIQQYNIIDDLEKLVQAIESETFLSGELRKSDRFDNSISRHLRQFRVNLTTMMPNKFKSELGFGILLVKFGQHHGIQQVAEELTKHGELFNIPIRAARQDESTQSGAVKIALDVPVHKVLGVQFKPFVDVSDMALIEDVQKWLEKEGVEDISVSSSAERQRIYFLFPKERQIGVTETPEGIKNNYVYPI